MEDMKVFIRIGTTSTSTSDGGAGEKVTWKCKSSSASLSSSQALNYSNTFSLPTEGSNILTFVVV